MTKPSSARYRTTNWSSYTAALRERGTLLIWLHNYMTWLAVFSDAAIQFCLTIKVLFELPLRQTTGVVASLLKMADLGLVRTGQHEPVSTPEDARRPDPLPACIWPIEPARGQHRDQVPR